ncbi:MAG: hypothetical protein OHK93_001377 [Ramalina farinacea]|uniref:DUF7727 domain-containing protein n=1 Tax=Ramalina farinacea TaxID=258253 RepID=A0AA43QQB3_9LECA|nr:hypothetical protein [Ramalina farinacea]
MGKLIKNHWARLIILTAAAYQLLASLYAFFWPKLFFDFLTTTLDPCVRPIPILQIINLLLALLGLAWEWPLPLFVNASVRWQTRCRGGYRARRPSERANTTTGDTTKQGLQAAVTAAAVQMDATAAGGPGRHQEEEGRRRGRGSGGAMDAVLAGMHRSIEARLMVYPLSSLASLLMYQGTNAGLYYIIGMGVYFWAFSEGEVVMAVPWTLPKRRKAVGIV